VHALSRGEERLRAVGSKSDGGVPVRPAEARAGRGSGPAWPASAAPARFPFFPQGDFSFLQNDSKIQKIVENVMCIQNCDLTFYEVLVLHVNLCHCMCDF
jgi:hypothetical protein